MAKAKTKTPRKLVKRSSAKKESLKKVIAVSEPVASVNETQYPLRKVTRKSLIIAGLIAIVVIGLGIYNFRSVITPATVNGQPIYVWDYLSMLHTQFGSETLGTMTTDLLIKQEVKKTGTLVTPSELDAEIAEIEKEASASGGLTTVLAQQGLSMETFRERVQLQLEVKKLLADKTIATDEEINEAYTTNIALYKDIAEAEAKLSVKREIENQKFQEAVQTYLADLKTKSIIQVNLE